MSEMPPKPTSKPKKRLPKAKALKDKESTSKKATIAEQIQRVSEIQSLLLQGYTRSYILQYSAKWGLQDRQIDNYIAEATVNIKEVSRAGLESDLAVLISAMWDTFRRAVIANNVGEQRQPLWLLLSLKDLMRHVLTM